MVDADLILTMAGEHRRYLLDEWLPLAQTDLRHSTYDSYRRNAELHVVPRIGRTALQKVRPIDLTKFYAELLRDGRRDGRGDGPW